MTRDEFKPLAERISALWPPAMSAAAVGAYFDVVGELSVVRLRKALDVVAQTPRERRPPAGLLLETAQSFDERGGRAEPEAERVLTTEQHRAALVELGRPMTAEHRRRHRAVAELLPKRVPLPLLGQLMPEKRTPAAVFDLRMAELRRELLGVTVTAPDGPPRCPQGCDEGYDVLADGWRACLGCGRTWCQEASA